MSFSQNASVWYIHRYAVDDSICQCSKRKSSPLIGCIMFGTCAFESCVHCWVWMSMGDADLVEDIFHQCQTYCGQWATSWRSCWAKNGDSYVQWLSGVMSWCGTTALMMQGTGNAEREGCHKGKGGVKPWCSLCIYGGHWCSLCIIVCQPTIIWRLEFTQWCNCWHIKHCCCQEVREPALCCGSLCSLYKGRLCMQVIWNTDVGRVNKAG
jgi:hypothetical protein